MTVPLYLILASLGLGTVGLIAFLWSLGKGQYDDLDGAAERILLDDAEYGASRTVRQSTNRKAKKDDPTHVPARNT